MRLSIVFLVFTFLIATIGAKPVTHIDLEDFFKEYSIESSTEKFFFRAPAWTGGCMRFVFKVYKPHPEFELEFMLTAVPQNSTDDDLVNSQRWALSRHYSQSYNAEDYDIYYYHQNYPIGYKGDVGIYFSSDKNYKMTFAVRGVGYIFPIDSFEEKIVDDFECTHYFNATIVGEGNKDMSFVIRVYKPMDVYDFALSARADYETEGKSEVIKFGNYRIKEGNDYIQFSYPFYIGKDIKSVIFNLSSSQHYKLGFYLSYDKVYSLSTESN